MNALFAHDDGETVTDAAPSFTSRERERASLLSKGGQAAHATHGETDNDGSRAKGGQAAHATDAEHVEFTGTLYQLAKFGDLELTISYYIDTLTLVMFVMVTFIASLIHIYSAGYMHEELETFVDPEVKTAGGEPLHRPGRYPRFFTYLSLLRSK